MTSTRERAGRLEPSDLGIGSLFWKIQEAIAVGEAESGRIVLWNPAAERLFGYSAAEIGGRAIEVLVPEALQEHHRVGLARYAKTGHGSFLDGGRPIAAPGRHQLGHEIPVELTLHRLDDVELPGRYVLALIRDASERQAAEALRVRRARQVALSADVRAALADG